MAASSVSTSAGKNMCNCALVYMLLLVTAALVAYIAYDSYGNNGLLERGVAPAKRSSIQQPDDFLSIPHEWAPRRRQRVRWADTVNHAPEGFANPTRGVTIDNTSKLDQFYSNANKKILWLHHTGCVHCHRMKAAWGDVERKCPSNVTAYSASNAQEPQWSKLCDKYGASGFPTILIFDTPEQYSEYNGPRTSSAILAAVQS